MQLRREADRVCRVDPPAEADTGRRDDHVRRVRDDGTRVGDELGVVVVGHHAQRWRELGDRAAPRERGAQLSGAAVCRDEDRTTGHGLAYRSVHRLTFVEAAVGTAKSDVRDRDPAAGLSVQIGGYEPTGRVFRRYVVILTRWCTSL